MQISHLMVGLEQQIETQLRFADSERSEMMEEILAVIAPAIRQTLFTTVETAVSEINSQLTGLQVEVKLVDGDPELVVATSSVPPPPAPPDAPDFDESRITLRIPSNLKEIIAEAAKAAGDSVNSYVVDALRTSTHATTTKKNVTGTIKL